MEFDDSHQRLKAQLMACFDRASRSVDSTQKKTRDIRIAIDEGTEDKDSRIFKLTQRFNGAKEKEEDEENSGD